MIYILCAMPCEAQPIIDKYALKLEGRLYCNEQISLIITGIGKVNMAYSMGYIASRVTSNDLLFNIGVCAGRKQGIYEIVKATDSDSCRDFYPDIVINSNLPKANLITVSRLITDGDIGDDLYDMEGSAFVESAFKIAGPHQIGLLKIVSDSGHGDVITDDYIRSLVCDNIDVIDSYIKRFSSVVIANDLVIDIDSLSQDLKCTVYMFNELLTLIKYAKLSEINYESFFESLYADEKVPVKSKKEGKEIIDALRQYVTL